jgi:SAM-dependent methyltransferase
LKRFPRVYWVLRRARTVVGNTLPPVTLPGVPGRVHRNDTMIPKPTPEHADFYNSGGLDAATFVADAVAATDRRTPPDAGLDLGCGYGRVLRHLVRTFPETTWTACDVEPGAVRFCRREFGAVPVASKPHLGEVQFPSAPYDIVWMGSLLTHLDAAANDELAGVLAQVTRPGAVVAFSTHPPSLTSELENFGPGMEHSRGEADAELGSTGFAYVPYPHYADGSYGIAFHDRAYVDRLFRAAFEGRIERIDLGVRTWMAGHELHAFVVTA